MIYVENFENAGVKVETFGVNKQFTRKILIPWTFRSDSELNLISIIEHIVDKYTIINSLSTCGLHHARIVDNKLGTTFEIDIHEKHIRVYPTEENHAESSNKLRNLLFNSLI